MKNMFKFALAAVALAGMLPIATSPLLASRAVKRGKLVVDPKLGYILIRVGPASGKSGAVPPVYLARLDPQTGQTMWNFGDSNIDSRKALDVAMVSGGGNWGTDGKTSWYVVPVNPGRWVIGGANATTLSLGSYGFDVEPGALTYVGTVQTAREDGKSDIPELQRSRLSQDLVDFGVMMNIVMSDAVMVTAPGAEEQIPAGLEVLPLKRATLLPDVRFNNFLRALVNRAVGLPPIEHQTLTQERFNLRPVAAPSAAPATPAAPAAGSAPQPSEGGVR